MEAWREVWDRLLAESPGATLFQSFCWNRLAAAWFTDREAPFVVLAESGSSLALIPASVTRTGISFLGETLFDYRDVLCAGSDEALWEAWRRIADLQLPVSISGLRDGGQWRLFEPAMLVNAPQVPRSMVTPDAFAARHSRLGRTLGLLAKRGARMRRYDGTAQAMIAWLYRAKANQLAGSASLFSDARRREFMVAACGLNPSACEIFTLETAGGPVAALLTFRDRRVCRFYTIWFDSRWAKLSPGTALIYAATIDALAAGLDCDYMTGEQPHKMRFALSLDPLYRLHVTAERLANVAGADLVHAA
jgi:CelD/BcsL family acetyltransferase involved in cellulose biosynthesis